MEDMADKKALLEELMQFARGGMAKDMRSRFGKPPADEDMLDGGADDATEGKPPEDPEIPGVEAVAEDSPGPDGSMPGAVDAGDSGIDPAALQALLEALKAKGG